MAFRPPTLAPTRHTPNRREDTAPSDSFRVETLDAERRHLYQPSKRRRPSLDQQHIGPSILSDFGSLNTVPRSECEESELRHNTEDVVDEFDSLDDGLHAFREPFFQTPSQQSDPSVGAILPAHDGLGTFSPLRTPFDDRARSPARHFPIIAPTVESHARLQSVAPLGTSSDGLAKELPQLDGTRFDRIEKWRLEQSNYLLAEIEKEKGRSEESHISKSQNRQQEDQTARYQSAQFPVEPHCETTWQQLAHHVLRGLMGIDDSTLFVIFGEDPPGDEILHSKTPKLSDKASRAEESGFFIGRSQVFLLRRLKERLQNLAQQLTPNARTWSEIDSLGFDYAGIPINWISNRGPDEKSPSAGSMKMDDLNFLPTLQQDLPKTSDRDNNATKLDEAMSSEKDRVATGREYWAQVSGLRSILRLLYRRFLNGSSLSQGQTQANLATSYSPETLRRAAIIQQHHPLVSSPKSKKTNPDRSFRFQSSFEGSNYPVLPGTLKRPITSCASMSTKRSRLPRSDGASRNYWDLRDSAATSSAVFAGVGTWAEF